jgi:hypothetical protein
MVSVHAYISLPSGLYTSIRLVVGYIDGAKVGSLVGNFDGVPVGSQEGTVLGSNVGSGDGTPDGSRDGIRVGSGVGKLVIVG